MTTSVCACSRRINECVIFAFVIDCCTFCVAVDKALARVANAVVRSYPNRTDIQLLSVRGCSTCFSLMPGLVAVCCCLENSGRMHTLQGKQLRTLAGAAVVCIHEHSVRADGASNDSSWCIQWFGGATEHTTANTVHSRNAVRLEMSTNTHFNFAKTKVLSWDSSF